MNKYMMLIAFVLLISLILLSRITFSDNQNPISYFAGAGYAGTYFDSEINLWGRIPRKISIGDYYNSKPTIETTNINLSQYGNILKVVGGENTCVVLFDNGQVALWGAPWLYDLDSELFDYDNQNGDVILSFDTYKINDISAKDNHIVFAIDKKIISIVNLDSGVKIEQFSFDFDIKRIEAGATHGMALLSDGSLIEWGG